MPGGDALPSASCGGGAVSSDPWGRVDETGTVYVRTADGEQVVGSWQAGTPEEALAYFERKYEGLVVEIGLLERRVRTTDLSAKDAMAAIGHLRQQIDEHHAVGDLDALRKRLDQLVADVEARREERKAQKARQSDEARQAKEKLVAEAEELAASEQWRAAGERLRALVDSWKSLPRLDRKSDDELWHRFSHARSAFSKRRKAHFASLDAQREEARKTKERLVAEAEALSGSTDWGPTAARYRELMADWKAAGRAQREHEDDLWNRFRGAQDIFFQARSEVFAERDAEQRENLTRKEELVAEAEKLLPVQDLKAARAAFRSINERWEAIGHVPRDARPKIEGRMHAVERAIQESEEAEWRRTNPEARARAAGLTGQLQDAVDKLQKQIDAARAAGNDAKADKLARELEGRQALLDQALKGLEEFGG
ncbi:DNA repair protein [Streptomyces rimosus subsp. rimosus]|nr:DNA repair protein [Streptomyces sp. NRRL WC-3701]KOT36010.1 DNA repair protein [Streptomyces rimosus subsp. rimosus]KOT91142.1 DNA repair protein [Streptomyces rimosus subsp. pseudoverticillatus]KOT53604.1 DNA repair protein [Streptomyces rimosus subsp. rimosus]KOT56695.1 DNA repair protein [Streptomyces rimosus subsp. rimosus]